MVGEPDALPEDIFGAILFVWGEVSGAELPVTVCDRGNAPVLVSVCGGDKNLAPASLWGETGSDLASPMAFGLPGGTGTLLRLGV